MRLRSGCPTNRMPNMSQTSRSSQLAESHSDTSESTARASVVRPHLDSQAVPQRDRDQVIHDVEPRVTPEVIDRRDVGEHVELQPRVLFQKLHHLQQVSGLDQGDGISLRLAGLEDPLGKRLAQDAQQRRWITDGLLSRSVYSHSSAPIFHAYTNPTPTTMKNTSISTKPKTPSSRKTTAHGKRNASSTSKSMNNRAIR